MSEQVRTSVNVEEMVGQPSNEPELLMVDTLTLVKTITRNVTLLKDVWVQPVFGKFNIFAGFGLPDSEEWPVTLVAEE